MNKNIDKWEINRLPTTGERIVGIVSGVIATLFCGGLSVIWLINKKSTEFNASEDAIYLALLFFAGVSLWITLKAIIGQPKRPTKFAAFITSSICLVLSLIMIVFGLFSEAGANRIQMMSIGLVGLGSILPIFQKGLRERIKT